MECKRIIALGMAIFMTAANMTGCGKNQNPAQSATVSESTKNETKTPTTNVDYSAGLTDDGFYEGVSAKDYVTLPEDYKAIPADFVDVKPDTYSISNSMQYLRSSVGSVTEITDRAAQMGDNVVVSYEGRVDGETYLGSTVDHHYATLGMNDLVYGLEEQVVGHKPGDKFTATITFPDDYPDTTDNQGQILVLAGKEGQFDVTLESIENMTLEDTAIEKYFEEQGLTLLDGSKIDTVEKAVQYYYEQEYEANKQTFAVQYLMDNSTVTEYPQSVLSQQYQNELLYAQKQSEIAGYNSLSDFLADYGYETTDDFLYACQEDVETNTKRTLILQAIAELHNIKATETSYDEYYGGDPSIALETYGTGFVAQTVLDYEVIKNLCENMLILNEQETPTEIEQTDDLEASSEVASIDVNSADQSEN